jgi:calreticulin
MESLVLLLLGLVTLCNCDIQFKDEFADETWEKRWAYSNNKGSDGSKFKLTSGKFYDDKTRDMGIQTSQDAKFYQISSKIETPFSNEGKTLVLQYTVKHEQGIDCGGGYIKLFPADIDAPTMHGDTPYYVMFGPDICGPGTKKVHVIFSYKGKNLLTKKDIRCKDDELTHLYTLILNSDNTYEVRIDGSKVESGKLEDDWDFLAPKTIKDPDAKKPADWDDRAKIDDPDDTKPEEWDKEPELIPDPEAKKPEDWDDEEDGDWEPAMINNPAHKGEWKAKQIDNPAYKGEWVHPEIANPDYVADSAIYKYDNVGHVGFEIWQVKSGTIFDNILVTDSIADAEAHAAETFEKTKVGEKKMKDEADEKERKEEEEREAKRKAEEDAKKPEDKKDDKEEDKDEEEEEEEEKEDKPTADETEEEAATPKDEL